MLNWTAFDNGKFVELCDKKRIRVILTVYDYTKPSNVYMRPTLDITISKNGSETQKVTFDANKVEWWIDQLLPFSMTPFRKLFKEEEKKYYNRREWMWQNGPGLKNTSDNHTNL